MNNKLALSLAKEIRRTWKEKEKYDSLLYEKIVQLKLKVDNVINSAKKEIERKLERPIFTSENYIELTEDNDLKLPN